MDLFDSPPPALNFATERRGYTSYKDEVYAAVTNPMKWGRLKVIPFPLGDVSEDVAEADRQDVATKIARKRANYTRAMVLSGKGEFAGKQWKVLLAQPDGPGTDLEVWISYQGPKVPKQDAPAASDPAASDPATGQGDPGEGGGQGDAPVAGQADPGDEAKPRARRGAAA